MTEHFDSRAATLSQPAAMQDRSESARATRSGYDAYNAEEAWPALSAAAEEYRCIPTMEVDMCQRKQLTVVLLSILMAGCHGASTGWQNNAATAEGSTPQAVGPSAASRGVGSGAAFRVSFTEAATSADAQTRAPTNPDRVELDQGRFRELPSIPTSGTRKQASTPGFATPQTSRIRPCDVAVFLCPFDGVAQDNCASCTN